VFQRTIFLWRFLFLAPVEQTGQVPFTVVLNWQAGLKK
jgi:hypothetical protein